MVNQMIIILMNPTTSSYFVENVAPRPVAVEQPRDNQQGALTLGGNDLLDTDNIQMPTLQ